MALNGLGAALGYQFSRRPRQLRSATKRGYVYLALAVLNILLIIDLLVLIATAGQSPPVTTGEGSKPAVTPEKLADALLTPTDMSSLGRMVVQDQQRGTGAGVTSSGLTLSYITYVSGDPACKGVLEAHPVIPAEWAWLEMTDNPEYAESTVRVTEDLEAFPSKAEAQRVMQQNLEQVANCRAFIGDTEYFDGTAERIKYSHRIISVPTFGDETIAHQVVGDAKDGTFFLENIVEIRSGTDVIFINYSPSERGVARTVDIATAAWEKYSRIR